MQAEFYSLKMSFGQHRQKFSDKRKVIYPANLRRRASALVSQGTRLNRVARELGDSFYLALYFLFDLIDSLPKMDYIYFYIGSDSGEGVL